MSSTPVVHIDLFQSFESAQKNRVKIENEDIPQLQEAFRNTYWFQFFERYCIRQQLNSKEQTLNFTNSIIKDYEFKIKEELQAQVQAQALAQALAQAQEYERSKWWYEKVWDERFGLFLGGILAPTLTRFTGKYLRWNEKQIQFRSLLTGESTFLVWKYCC